MTVSFSLTWHNVNKAAQISKSKNSDRHSLYEEHFAFFDNFEKNTDSLQKLQSFVKNLNRYSNL